MEQERIFKRKIYDKMLQWKQTRDGATALLIKGARRVGKSTIAEEFARREYESYILEVKSSGYNTYKSLDEFCTKFSQHVSNRYLIYTKDLKKDHETTLLPVFMTIFL